MKKGGYDAQGGSREAPISEVLQEYMPDAFFRVAFQVTLVSVLKLIRQGREKSLIQ